MRSPKFKVFPVHLSEECDYEQTLFTYGDDASCLLNRSITLTELKVAIHRMMPPAPGEDKLSPVLFKGLNDLLKN